SLLLTGLVLGIVNAFIRPIIELISAPITCLTLGIFHFVIGAIMLYLVSLIPALGFALNGPVAAFLGAIVIAIVGAVLSCVLPDRTSALLRCLRRRAAPPLQRDPPPPSGRRSRRRPAVDRRGAPHARGAAGPRRQGDRHDAPFGEGPPRHPAFTLWIGQERDARARRELRLQVRAAARRGPRLRCAVHGEPVLHTRAARPHRA